MISDTGQIYHIKWSSNCMFWLKLVEVIVILTIGIFLIAFLEDTFVSAPCRRELQRKARERLGKSGKQDGD